MTDTNKRPVIDLDELERQLREAADKREAPPAPVSAQEDPLAELARIVGQEDPFRSLWADKAARPPASTAEPVSAASFASELAALDRVGQPLPPHAGEPPPLAAEAVHGDVPASAPATFVPEEAPRYAASDPHFEEEGQLPPLDEEFAEEMAEPKKSRRGLYVMASVVGVAAIGIAGALAMRSSAPTAPSAGGPPPLIKAEAAPVKVPPREPGGVEVPNQDRQVYAKGVGEDPKAVKVTGGEEQPVDIAQATRRDTPMAPESAANAAATSTSPAAASKPAAAPLPGLGEPRRVRTVSVRPDGTIIDGSAPPADRPPERVAALAGAPARPVDRPAPSAAPSVPVVPWGSAPTPANSTTPAAPAKPKAATTGATPPAPTPTPARPQPRGADADGSTAAGAPPRAATPSPARVANAPQAGVPQPAPVGVPQPSPDQAANGGGFAVQLAAPPTEQEARDTLSRLTRRFADDLDGLKPAIRKADVNGKTIYRVRVSGLSREEATNLCEKLKAGGGQCFVAKN